MKVGIVGMGRVGEAVWGVLDLKHECILYDPSPEWVEYIRDKSAINECEIAFVCVPTPSGPDGRLDVSAVDDVLSWLRVPLIVIRSTMPEFCKDHEWTTFAGQPGIYVVYQPEFIGESPFAPWQAESDVGLVVAGGTKAQAVCDFWKPILGPRVTYIATDWQTAAQIKFAVNCHGAVKAAWWREFLGNCTRPDEVRNAVMQIPWIDPYHTLPIGDCVGGKCFPKDLRHWVAANGGPIGNAALGYMKDKRCDGNGCTPSAHAPDCAVLFQPKSGFLGIRERECQYKGGCDSPWCRGPLECDGPRAAGDNLGSGPVPRPPYWVKYQEKVEAELIGAAKGDKIKILLDHSRGVPLAHQ